MSEIPEDFREKIEALWYEAMAEASPAPFARAILAERERCAKIAEKTHAPFTALAIRKGDAP
jgi:hypothetical protein